MSSDFPPLLTGIIAGLLMKQEILDISVAPVKDKNNDYLTKIVVRSNLTGSAVVISVDDLGPT
jgi:hypothetical protein